nr:hypothetical protein [Tanacetum cinerariifolium]
ERINWGRMVSELATVGTLNTKQKLKKITNTVVTSTVKMVNGIDNEKMVIGTKMRDTWKMLIGIIGKKVGDTEKIPIEKREHGILRDWRVSKQEETKYRDYVHEERKSDKVPPRTREKISQKDGNKNDHSVQGPTDEVLSGVTETQIKNEENQPIVNTLEVLKVADQVSRAWK